jgi:Ice-binding-like
LISHRLLSVVLCLTACEYSPPREASGDVDAMLAEPSDDAAIDAAGVGVPVNLGTAGDFVILGESAISGTGALVTGDLGISPGFATSVTGFSLNADGTNTFSTSAQVTGKIYTADYATTTPAKLTAAVIDMGLAFTEAAAREPDVTTLGGDIGGTTLVPGVYRWTTPLMIGADLTLSGSSTDVWIFQISQTLDMAAGKTVLLTGGALAKNVFWQVSGAVTIGASAHLEGVVLTATAVTFGAGTSIKGRLLAQTAVTITGSIIVQP